MRTAIVTTLIATVLFLGAWLTYRRRLGRPSRNHKREYRQEVMRHAAKDRAKWDVMFDR